MSNTDPFKDPFKDSFKVSFKITPIQVVIIVSLIVLVIAGFFSFRYITNPNRTNPFTNVYNTASKDTLPDKITLPIIKKEVDISFIKNNPNTLNYIGYGFIVFSMILMIPLVKFLLKD